MEASNQLNSQPVKVWEFFCIQFFHFFVFDFLYQDKHTPKCQWSFLGIFVGYQLVVKLQVHNKDELKFLRGKPIFSRCFSRFLFKGAVEMSQAVVVKHI